MDTLRGNFADRADLIDGEDRYEAAEDENVRDAPPPEIGQDERRMQVRAYNHWASLLEDRNFPSIDDLEPDNLPDFGPYSVLLDFTSGIEDPGVSYIGDELAAECDAGGADIVRLSDVPSRSLLSRITDHYMQILANQAPIGFEAEFINQRGTTILYRGILLPFSSDDDTIDFIYGVINWKELADQATTDELMLEIDQALEDAPETPPVRHEDAPMTDWADGPAAIGGASDDDDVVDLGAIAESWDDGDEALPSPTFGAQEPTEQVWAGPEEGDAPYELDPESELSGDENVDAIEPFHAPAVEYGDEGFADKATEIELPEIDEDEMGLGDWLASARELAMAARSSEDRTRNALYEAISRAYDFSIAAAHAPDEFNEIVADSGLTMQDRAPMTPVVKLVFGPDYDKTRLTEYASALSHAHRMGLARGSLGEYLRSAEGGLKGVVQAERRLRREESGKPVDPLDAPRERLAKKLRKIAPVDFADISPEGQEFALVMIRRTPEGEVVVLGEIPEDVALVERAARKLLD